MYAKLALTLNIDEYLIHGISSTFDTSKLFRADFLSPNNGSDFFLLLFSRFYIFLQIDKLFVNYRFNQSLEII